MPIPRKHNENPNMIMENEFAAPATSDERWEIRDERRDTIDESRESSLDGVTASIIFFSTFLAVKFRHQGGRKGTSRESLGWSLSDWWQCSHMTLSPPTPLNCWKGSRANWGPQPTNFLAGGEDQTLYIHIGQLRLKRICGSWRAIPQVI